MRLPMTPSVDQGPVLELLGSVLAKVCGRPAHKPTKTPSALGTSVNKRMRTCVGSAQDICPNASRVNTTQTSRRATRMEQNGIAGQPFGKTFGHGRPATASQV